MTRAYTGAQGYKRDWAFHMPEGPISHHNHTRLEIDHEIFSMVILSLLLIQEGQLSVSGKRMCTA